MISKFLLWLKMSRMRQHLVSVYKQHWTYEINFSLQHHIHYATMWCIFVFLIASPFSAIFCQTNVQHGFGPQVTSMSQYLSNALQTQAQQQHQQRTDHYGHDDHHGSVHWKKKNTNLTLSSICFATFQTKSALIWKQCQIMSLQLFIHRVFLL